MFGGRNWHARLMLIFCRMSKVCVQWSLEDLCDMEDIDMNELLQGYVPDQVPSLSQVRSGEELGVWQFDGSYGWSCVI